MYPGSGYELGCREQDDGVREVAHSCADRERELCGRRRGTGGWEEGCGDVEAFGGEF